MTTTSEGALEADEITSPAHPDLRVRQVGVWFVSWLSYGAYYFGRKGISVAKKPIAAALGESALYGVDTAYLAAYALGQYISGFFGDRVGARALVLGGMLVSALACFWFGASSAGTMFIIAFFVNGLAQATGWPGNMKAMGEWTTADQRGKVMGLWATCYQVGGIAATAFATFMLARSGWRAAFWAPACVLVIVGFLFFVIVRPAPVPRAIVRVEPDGAPAATATANIAEETRAARAALLRSPVIYFYGASYFCIKLIRYSLLFWLPYYMETVLKYGTERAGYTSTAFEVGGVAGTIAIGWISDRYRTMSRAAWSLFSLVALAGALFLFGKLAAAGPIISILSLALVGALLFGPDALISGAAAQDVGGPRATALAAGLVNGIGSLGAVLQELVTRGISTRFGWNALFIAFVVFSLLSAAALTYPAFIAPARQRTGR
ncbi:MAG TPA: MFS transporter [Polyangiaceae bacterium]|nr:MFS transporter [Polyangiaceae bacterium]